jgi:hypothetical protein
MSQDINSQLLITITITFVFARSTTPLSGLFIERTFLQSNAADRLKIRRQLIQREPLRALYPKLDGLGSPITRARYISTCFSFRAPAEEYFPSSISTRFPCRSPAMLRSGIFAQQ